MGTVDAWRFEGSKPLIKPNLAKGRMVQGAIDRGHFYCQCLKIGHIICNSTYPKYESFIVNQKWVIGLWQRRKLSHEHARYELIEARGHTASYLAEVDRVEALEDERAIEQEKAIIDAHLSKAFKDFRHVDDVALWKLQYGKDTMFSIWGKESRFKFLVLTGPSSLGKTQYAKALFGIQNTLVVGCQGVANPCLQSFRRKRHKAIIYDEISSKCIHNNKAIFQANNDKVVLGQSPTMRDCYTVFLYGVAMIVCCNDWLEDIARGSLEEDWLLKNAIVYNCTQRMWIQE